MFVGVPDVSKTQPSSIRSVSLRRRVWGRVLHLGRFTGLRLRGICIPLFVVSLLTVCICAGVVFLAVSSRLSEGASQSGGGGGVQRG